MCAGAVNNNIAVPPKMDPPLYTMPIAVDLYFLLNNSARKTGNVENIIASKNAWIENAVVNIIILSVYP